MLMLLMIYETKTDDIFPSAQFFIARYDPPYKLNEIVTNVTLIIYIYERISPQS